MTTQKLHISDNSDTFRDEFDASDHFSVQVWLFVNRVNLVWNGDPGR